MDKLLEIALLAWEATAGLFGSWKVVAVLGTIVAANVGGLVYLGTRGAPVPAQTLQAKPARVQKVDGAKPITEEEIKKAKKARAAKIKAQLQKKSK